MDDPRATALRIAQQLEELAAQIRSQVSDNAPLDPSRPTPPEHWLALVRGAAPQLLDQPGAGLIDAEDSLPPPTQPDIGPTEPLNQIETRADDTGAIHERLSAQHNDAGPVNRVEASSGKDATVQTSVHELPPGAEPVFATRESPSPVATFNQRETPPPESPATHQHETQAADDPIPIQQGRRQKAQSQPVSSVTSATPDVAMPYITEAAPLSENPISQIDPPAPVSSADRATVTDRQVTSAPITSSPTPIPSTPPRINWPALTPPVEADIDPHSTPMPGNHPQSPTRITEPGAEPTINNHASPANPADGPTIRTTTLGMTNQPQQIARSQNPADARPDQVVPPIPDIIHPAAITNRDYQTPAYHEASASFNPLPPTFSTSEASAHWPRLPDTSGSDASEDRTWWDVSRRERLKREQRGQR